MIIDLNKTYTTRDGKLVRLYCVDGGGSYPVHGAVRRDGIWDVERWTLKGDFINDCSETSYDLIEFNPWSNLKVDDRVIVRIKKTGESHNYHFAGLTDKGVPMLYTGQRSSWTASTTFSIDLDKDELIIP
jgi:hypothetical protein